MTHTVGWFDTAAVRKLQPSKYEDAKPCVNDVTNVVPVSQAPKAR